MLYFDIHYVTIFKHNGNFYYYKPPISFYEYIIFDIAKKYYDFEMNIFEMKNTAHIAMILNYFNYFYYNDWYNDISKVKCVNNAGGCWCNFGMFYRAAYSYNHMDL